MANVSFSFVANKSTANFKVFQAITRRYIQSGSGSCSQDAAAATKRGLDEAIKTSESLKNTAEKVAGCTKDSADGMASKAKQTAEGAWESAKETVHKTKDNVFSKADGAKETVKETAKRNMNTKNN